nr:hypothetical protein [uncultured Dyadobacter sp.]
MRRILYIGSILLVAGWLCACSKNEVPKQEPKPVKLSRDSVESALFKRFYVAEAYRFRGADSVDLFKLDTLYTIYRRAVYLQFRLDQGYVNFWSGNPIPNTTMPGSALTFSVRIRVELPTGLRIFWNEEKGTARVESETTVNTFPMIIPGKKAYLETATFRDYLYREQAAAAKVKPKMVFIYEDEDPKLGKVTYKITLKPMYEYYREPLQQAIADFVVY